MTDATLGASGLWLGTRTGADGTATLTKSFFFLAAAHGSMDKSFQTTFFHTSMIHLAVIAYILFSFLFIANGLIL